MTNLMAVYETMRDEGRELYQGRSGGWYLTYGAGGPFTDEDVRFIRTLEGIAPRYFHNGKLHEDCFCYGKTIDLDETVARRRAGTINKRECVYIDGTTGLPRP